GPPRLAGHGAGVERAYEQVAPPLEEERAVVELDLQHVALAGLVEAQEVVADLARARTEVEGALAEPRRVRAAHDAIVGGPDPAAGGIDDPRVLLGREPAVPAPRPVRPGDGPPPVEAHAPGHGPDHGPGDAAGLVRADEVLGRDAGAVRDRER